MSFVYWKKQMKDKNLLIDGSESQKQLLSYAVRNVKTHIMFNQSTLRLYDISSSYAPSFHPLSSFVSSIHSISRWYQPPSIFWILFLKLTTSGCLTFDRRWWNLFVRLPSNPYTMMNKDHVSTYWSRDYRFIEWRMNIVGQWQVEKNVEKVECTCFIEKIAWVTWTWMN